MSDWLDNQKQSNSSICQLLQERIEKANPRRQLTAEETKRLNKLKGIANRLKRGENVQSGGRVTYKLHANYCYNVNG